MRRKLLCAATAAAVIAVLAPPAPASSATALSSATAASATAGDRTSTLAWGACPPAPPDVERHPRQECATLRVPLDYRHPSGRQIDVAVSRIPAADPALRRGILLSNPGGPGGPGLDLPSQLAPLLPAPVLDRYDLIGFDPRGIAYSTPVSCQFDPATPPDLFIPFPAPDGSIARNVAFARQAARRCAEASGDLLPHISTANTARDMDRIRAALGERKLSYLGYSYGTYLGAVYATLFPGRTDRIILDSAVDPDRAWYRQWRAFSIGFATRLPDFTAWAAERDAVYGLGATRAAVHRTYVATAARLDQKPVDVPELGLTVDGNVFRLLTFALLYSDFTFPPLAEVWQVLQPAAGAPAAVARALAAATAGTVPPDNYNAAQYSVVCADAAWPRDTAVYARNVARDRRLFPDTAGFPANIWPCAFWRYQPVEPPVKVTGHGPRNVLILQNLRDPATPWITALGMRQSLGQRAAMVSVDQGGHGVYLQTLAPCASDIATAFLVSGVLPAVDRLCPGQSPPDAAARQRPPLVLPGPLGP